MKAKILVVEDDLNIQELICEFLKSQEYEVDSANDGIEALNKFKYEVANEIGVPLKKGYNGDLTSAQNGYVGGYMVKKMIEAQEKQMSQSSNQ